MIPNLFEGIRAFASSFGSPTIDVRTFFFGWLTASVSAARMEERRDFETKLGANDMSLQPNDAAAESPRRDSRPLPPNPFAGSPPRPSTSSRQSRNSIDLSSPTRPTKRMRPQEEPSAAVRPPRSRKRPSEDELRLVGDFRYLTSGHGELQSERLTPQKQTSRCGQRPRSNELAAQIIIQEGALSACYPCTVRLC
jgi:hypothetical protein